MIGRDQRYRRRLGIAVLACGLIGWSGATLAKPARIVSTNVCTDQLVLALADRERIASLSYLATDPRSSTMSRQAAGLPLNHGLAEELIPLEPDVVIASAFTTAATNAILRRFAIPVVEVPVATDFAGIGRNIAMVAEAIGEPAKGAALAQRFAARIAASGPPDIGEPPLAALYWANGYTSGRGTLANAVVEAAGFRTLGRNLGLTGTGILPMETLLVARPDILILGRDRAEAALAGAVLRHPALVRAFAGKAKISIPDNLWLCGTPQVASAFERLVRLRQALQQRSPR